MAAIPAPVFSAKISDGSACGIYVSRPARSALKTAPPSMTDGSEASWIAIICPGAIARWGPFKFHFGVSSAERGEKRPDEGVAVPRARENFARLFKRFVYPVDGF